MTDEITAIRNKRRQCALEIQDRVRLWDNESNIISIGKHWEPFNGGPAEMRIVPSLCSPRQTLMYFRAPAGTVFPLHQHEEVQVIVTLSKDNNPATIRMLQTGRVMHEGDVVTIGGSDMHGVEVGEEDVVLLLVWTPGFPQDPRNENRVLWTVT